MVGCVDCLEGGPENSAEEIRSFGGYNEKCYAAAIEKWNNWIKTYKNETL